MEKLEINNELDIKIKEIEAGDDPVITIYHVTLESVLGIWTESIGSRENLQWFLKGIQAGCTTITKTYVEIPPIP